MPDKDKALDEMISIYLDRAYKDHKARPLRLVKPSQKLRSPPERLPELERVLGNGGASPVKRYPYLIAFHWTRKDWWRFKRAAYANGRSGSDQLRELAERCASQYENSASED